MIYNNALEIVGNTPLVRINKLNPNPKVEILAKLEKYNPSGSVKDRIAIAMIEDAENRGILTKDKIIIEATSGNTGIGLAMACAIKGYGLTLIMPSCVSKERKDIMLAYGAQVILTDAQEGIDGSIRYLQYMIEKDPSKYIHLNQYANHVNWITHYYTTAEEILKDTNAMLNMFIAGMGTTGTICGVAKRLKEVRKNIHIVGVEPKKDASIWGLKNLEIQTKPPIYNPRVIDEIAYVGENESYGTARLLATEEGIFVGMSSGASMYVAIQKAKEMKTGRIVVLLPDGGEKYLSTGLFTSACSSDP